MGDAPQFRFEHWQMLWLLAVIGGVAAVIWLGLRLKARALRTFAHVESLRRIAASSSRSRRVTKAALLVVAFVLVMLALMRPQGAPREVTVTKRGRDIVFLLDVSRSMLAEDLRPNRLQRAKLAIEEMLDVMEGDRVGLIAFAGSRSLKCPLTHDYHFFKTVLDGTSPDDVGLGGTNIGDAIRMAVKQVLRPDEQSDEPSPRHDVTRDIVLITDGEDLEESAPITAARVAARYGIRIHTVGIGNPDGARVPHPDGGTMMFQGAEVRSRLDENTLREIAAATNGGRYVGVRTGIIDLTELYKRHIAAAEKKEATYRAVRYRDLYQWPLFLAVILLVIEALLSGRRPAAATLRTTALVVASALLVPSSARAASPDASRLVREGNAAYAEGDYSHAADKYKEAERALPESPQAQFNLGAALFKQGDYNGARKQFLDVFDSTESGAALRRRAVYNLGAATFRQAEQKLADGDLQAAVDAYRESVDLFRRAAGDDRQHEDALADDARWNTEVARLRMKQILDEIKRQQEQAKQQRQEQQRKDQELKDKLDKAVEEQKHIAEQSKQPQSSDEQRDALREKQQENLERTNELSKDLQHRLDQAQDQQQNQQLSQEQTKKALDELNESQSHQAEASNHLENRNDQRAQQSAEKALENLEKARDELQKKQPQHEQAKNKEGDEQGERQQSEAKQQAEQQSDQQEHSGQAQRVSQEEAQRMLEQLQKQEAQRRAARADELRRRGFRPYDEREREKVRRDW